MSLRDVMDADLTAVFLNDQDFAEIGTFKPRGKAPGFAVTVLRGDAQPTVGGEPVRSASAAVRLLANLAEIRAGIETAEGTARDPFEGDQIVLGADVITLQAPEHEAADSNAIHLFGVIASATGLSVLRKA